MSRKPRFTDQSPGWEPTPDEIAAMSVARRRLELVDRIRAGADALEQEALSSAAEVAQTQVARARGETADDGTGGYLFPVRSLAAELAVAVRESPQSMQRRMLAASILTTRFPVTTKAVREGRITGKYAALIREHGERLPDGEKLTEYETKAVRFAEEASLRQTKVFVRTLAARLAPESQAERRERTRKRRGVWARDLDDGLAELAIVDVAPVIHGALDRLTSMGYAVKRERARQERDAVAVYEAREGRSVGGPDRPVVDEDGYARHPQHVGDIETSSPRKEARSDGTEEILEADTRRLSELRADLAIDLLLSGLPSAHAACDPSGVNALDAIRATVNITIPATTLAGLDDEGAFLAGHGPVDADTARRLAGGAPGWDRLFRDPDTGVLLTVDRYTPTPAQRRFLVARDESCRFPYCDVLARRADIDHTIAHQHDGPTAVTNLEALCEGHHMDKHHTPWTVTQHPGGVLEWTSPLGRARTDIPQPMARAIALAAGPPGDDPGGSDPPPF